MTLKVEVVKNFTYLRVDEAETSPFFSHFQWQVLQVVSISDIRLELQS